MVSFVCDYCQETIKKPKLEAHKSRCRYAQFSCIDCSVSFQGTEYRAHTSCISEAEKYQGSTFKGSKKGQTKSHAVVKSEENVEPNEKETGNIAKPVPALSIVEQIKSKEKRKEESSISKEEKPNIEKKEEKPNMEKKQKSMFKIVKKVWKKVESPTSITIQHLLEKSFTKFQGKSKDGDSGFDFAQFSSLVLGKLTISNEGTISFP